MSKSSPSVTRASGIILPSVVGDITYSGERVPALQFVLSGRNGSACAGVVSVRPVVQVPGAMGTVAPPPDRFDLAGKGIIILPSQLPPEGDSPEALVKDLEEWISRYVDIGPLWTSIMTRYVLMTWLFDKFTAVPYLRFLGEPQSGKTRCLQIASSLSYKCISMAGASSASSLFRLIDLWRGTVSLDEADYRGDLYSDIIKLLNQGYMHGQYVMKSEKEGTTFDPRGFNVFGPKILTTRREFEDFALESRCLTLRMRDAIPDPRIPRQLPLSFAEEALLLRNRLLGWRFSQYDHLQIDESELLALLPRLTQISLPLWSVSKLIPGDAKFREALLTFLGASGAEARSLTPPAIVAEALRRETEGWIWKNGSANGASGGEGRHVALRDLAESCGGVAQDWGSGDGLKFTPRTVGTILRAWGLEPFKSAGGVYELSVTRDLIEDLSGRFRPPESASTL